MDQWSSHFIRIEAILISVGALPQSHMLPVFVSVKVGVSHPPAGAISSAAFILQPTPFTSVAVSASQF